VSHCETAAVQAQGAGVGSAGDGGGEGPARGGGEEELVGRLRHGDEDAFSEVVERHHPAMMRLARSIVRDAAVAEEVVQDAWLGMLRGIGSFAFRSSLRTWLFRILVNRARTAARRESRSVPFSAASGEAAGEEERLFDESEFRHPLAPGHWTRPVRSWGRSPEDEVLGAESRAVLELALEELPPSQRAVITLRDVEGWSAEETCNILELSGVHQRVLLHRARTKVRRALERYFDRESA
jgi:RNA polymerase sigma-70 factor (ECF subfamily)